MTEKTELKINQVRTFSAIMNGPHFMTNFSIIAGVSDGDIVWECVPPHICPPPHPPFGNYYLVSANKNADMWWISTVDIPKLHPIKGDLIWLWDSEGECYNQAIVTNVERAQYTLRFSPGVSDDIVTYTPNDFFDEPEIVGWQIEVDGDYLGNLNIWDMDIKKDPHTNNGFEKKEYAQAVAKMIAPYVNKRSTIEVVGVTKDGFSIRFYHDVEPV